MKIYLTGTPGTGKSTLSVLLKNSYSDLKIYEIKDFLIKFNLLEEYEADRDTTVFDDQKAVFTIQNELKTQDNFILVGPPLDFKEINFTCVIVLTCSKISILQERLKVRGYKKSKIDENIEAELLGEILGEILDMFRNKTQILVLDSCKLSEEELVSEIKTKLYI